MQECIVRLKPSVEIMALHGRLHQLRRMQIYDDFCHKNYAVMLATDVAARGLGLWFVSFFLSYRFKIDGFMKH